MLGEYEVYRPYEAIVFFGGNKTYWWTRFLKKGYYHCIIDMNIGYDRWVLIDPVMSYTDFIVFEGDDFIKKLAGMGYTYLMTKPTPIQFLNIKWSLRPFTCVEVVKRLLCIKKSFIITPYQLYKYIKKEEQ